MWIPPLLIIPLLIYDAVHFGFIGGNALGWVTPVASFTLPSGAIWSMNVGDVLVVFALLLLLAESVRARRTIGRGFVATMGSLVVFLVYLGQFLFFPGASTSLFFTCMVMSLVDVVTRLAVSGRANRQDY